MNKIKIVSRIMQIIFLLMLILTPIAYILFWSTEGNQVFAQLNWNMSNIPASMWEKMTQGEIPQDTRIVAFIISLIPIFTFMFLYFYLTKLFGAYGRGEIFTEQTVKYIRNCGVTLLLWQFLYPLYQILLTFTLSINNLPGQRFIAVSISTAQARDLVISIVIILISWIMQRAVSLEEEARLTV